MEYIDGKNIGEFIGDYWAPFATTTLDDVFIQLIDAFCYIQAHGIIHRDIREGNILIDKNGIVKVIDFGIGKIFTRSEENADSLASKINRAASDTLPKEYNDGVYTSLTDMFYLAEMFKRLIASAENCDTTDFSYNDILNKMMRNIGRKPVTRAFRKYAKPLGSIDFNEYEDIERTTERFIRILLVWCTNQLVHILKSRSLNADTAEFYKKD
jgi:serine/threonine-protein kinase